MNAVLTRKFRKNLDLAHKTRCTVPFEPKLCDKQDGAYKMKELWPFFCRDVAILSAHLYGLFLV